MGEVGKSVIGRVGPGSMPCPVFDTIVVSIVFESVVQAIVLTMRHWITVRCAVFEFPMIRAMFQVVVVLSVVFAGDLVATVKQTVQNYRQIGRFRWGIDIESGQDPHGDQAQCDAFHGLLL